jgi:hypothetical protein
MPFRASFRVADPPSTRLGVRLNPIRRRMCAHEAPLFPPSGKAETCGDEKVLGEEI